MAGRKVVLSVGQCRPDQAAITHYLNSHFDVEVLTADLKETALKKILDRTVDLVLVNRKLDEDGSDGMEIIAEILQQDEPRPKVMLVSNYPDWQQKAVQMGAAPGFGKAELNSAHTRQRFADALEHGVQG